MKFVFLVSALSAGVIWAQSTDFSVEGLPVQVHGFASQAFLATDNNNYLTMPTSTGSFAFTDFGGNISVQINGNFRVGAQLYDRNVGELGRWYPELDWASGDYRFKDWLGIRAGKMKTVVGLYNDTQDLEFLHTWALLPQSMYPVDLRTIISHIGGDVYGDISLQRLGSLDYTIHAGLIPGDPHGGYFYGSKAYGIDFTSLGAKSRGADLRWNMPLEGLLAGVSYVNASSNNKGMGPIGEPFTGRSKKYYVEQFFIEYVHGGLRLDGEYRRTYLDDVTLDPILPPETILDNRSFYGSASYRLSKRIEIGTYYSRFYLNWGASHSDPGNHIFDKVATIRLDLTSHWDLKLEGHFMNGYGASDAFRGFYLQDNPQGFKPNTNLLVIRTGIEF